MLVALGKLEDIAQRLCGVAIVIVFAAMVMIGGLEVFNRSLLSNSLPWSEEYQRYSQAWLVFLAVPYAYSRLAHIGMNVLTDRLPAPMRRILGLAVDATWAAVGIILMVTGARIVDLGIVQRSPGLGVSMGAVYAVIIISGAYLSLLAAIHLLRRLMNDQETPLR